MGGTTNRLGRMVFVMLAAMVVAMQAALVTAAAPRTADRPLHIVFESAEYNPETGYVDFTLQFDRPPNFREVDEFGRPADAFQYFVGVGDETLPDVERFETIIRGVELQLKGGVSQRVLPIRNSAPADPDPAAGGWGTIRATVPFQLHGRVLTFSAALSALSDESTDGRFTYIVETYRFGALVDSIENESVVPS